MRSLLKASSEGGWAWLTKPNSLAAEQYRMIRAKLLRLKTERPLTTVAVTSAVVGEGKSTTSSNLAYVLSRSIGHRVALIDCDLRRPTLHTVFNMPISPGLSELLKDTAVLDHVLRPFDDGRLCVVPSGRIPSNPTELLGSEAMDRILQQLRGRFEFVILDVPPVLPLADPFVLGCKADGIVIVVRAGRTPRDVVTMALDNLPRDRVIGVILNDARMDDSPYQRYAHTQYERAYLSM